ncbi:MAG: hypothetical protein QOK15_2522 [Nocardioidaceae bacterium]|nr:hypothetical protein [Nocardioidaceae bacterium]
MSTLTVWKFDTTYGAEHGGQTLRDLSGPERESLHDAARVTWVRGTNAPTTHPMSELASDEALGGAFWGLFFGLIFFSPLIGAAVGSAHGALSGSLGDFGIDDTFVNRVRDTVTPGTSALFVLGSDTVVDQVRDALRGDPPVKVLVTNLSRSQEGALREVFVS